MKLVFLKHIKAALLLMTMLEGTAKDAQNYAETYATYLWTATDPELTVDGGEFKAVKRPFGD
ncbi:hypothetical protein [Burkholderia pyrrocinia]|uniref:Uncharacterized protein n=1 Tax=Burkholderia pyrrocinia TaxID=60550 RepID=A0ABZ3BN13_BURPY